MAASSATVEQQLLSRVQAMCRGDVDFSVDMALKEILEFGVQVRHRWARRVGGAHA
jgi:hypothetical protein